MSYVINSRAVLCKKLIWILSDLCWTTFIKKSWRWLPVMNNDFLYLWAAGLHQPHTSIIQNVFSYSHVDPKLKKKLNLWICKVDLNWCLFIYLPIYAFKTLLERLSILMLATNAKYANNNLDVRRINDDESSVLIVWHKLFWSCGAQGLWLNCIISREHNLFMKRWYYAWASCLCFTTRNTAQNDLNS